MNNSDFVDKTPSGRVRRIISIIIRVLVAAVISFVLYYLFLPPINVFSRRFWMYLFGVLLTFSVCFGAFNLKALKKLPRKGKKSNGLFSLLDRGLLSRISAILVAIPLVVILVGTIISSVAFNARKYAAVITVNERDFETDMPETNEITNIALMDTDSAIKLGDRKLGALSDVVSQYVVSNDYTQINYHGVPMKATHLEYDGFFKWLGNRSKGIPGYIMVNALESTAEYYEIAEGIRYAQSGYFGDDLMRRIRFDYPTKIFDLDDVSFEIDENGNPFYCISCYHPRVGLFGARDVFELIIFNPIDGTSEIYAVEDVPQWVDIVFDGYLACDKYDWQGIYSGGFINSIIGNKGCKQTTDDFGYLMFDDDVWYFTGVTSITSDASNIGFILSNARTGEYRFYPVIGAEEHSAMSAAEGKVQEKEYVASFPSLVNISGVPTYIMMLKDANGLPRLYALVNVRQYGMVATGETQSEVIASYLRMLQQSGVDTSGSQGNNKLNVEVKDIKFLNMQNASYAYVTDTEGRVFRVEFNELNEGIILLNAGDRLSITATENPETGIFTVVEWEKTDEVTE